MRKLVTIRKIDSLVSIPGADQIECAKIDGWSVVVKKGEFKENEYCVFFEIDSFLGASDERFSFLRKNEIVWNGRKGMRLKTIKLRGQISQGLALPLSQFPEILDSSSPDLDAIIGVEKWEPVQAVGFHGQPKGSWPHYLRKTDQERIQNCKHILSTDADEKYEVTIKLDGSSMTIFNFNEESGVCSRNVYLKDDEDSAFTRTAASIGILEILKDMGVNVAVQGELIGPGIQGNHEGLTEHKFYIYDIFNIDEHRYFTFGERIYMVGNLAAQGARINCVPFLDLLRLSWFSNDIEKVLDFAEGPSLNPNVSREGIVFKRLDGKFSFKAISNSYLLKHSDR